METRWKRIALLAAGVVISIALLAAEYSVIRQHDRQAAQDTRQAMVRNDVNSLAQRLDSLQEQAFLLALATLQHNDRQPSMPVLSLVSREFIRPDAGITDITLIRRVLPVERADFETVNSLTIHGVNGLQQEPSPQRSIYFPVEASLPDGANALPRGLDMGVSSGWIRSLEWARNTAHPVLLVSRDAVGAPQRLYIAVTLKDNRWILLLGLNRDTLAYGENMAAGNRQDMSRLIAWEKTARGDSKILFDSRSGRPIPPEAPLHSLTYDIGDMKVMLFGYGGDIEKSSGTYTIMAFTATACLLLWLALYRLTARIDGYRLQLAAEREMRSADQSTLASIQDALVKTEQARLESEARQQAILRASTDAFVLIDRHGTIISANPAAAALANQAGETLESLPAGSVLPDLYDATGLIHFEALAEALGRQPFEGHLVRSDGSQLEVEMSLSRVDMPDDPFYLVVCRDISVRKEKEAALINLKNSLAEQVEMQRSQLAALLEASPMAMAYIVDRNLKQVNQAFLDMFQCDDEQEILNQSTLRFYQSEEQWLRTGRALYNLLNEGKVVKSELRLVTKHGRPFWCRLYGKALNPSVPGLGTIWLYQDFSSDRAVEDALRAAKELAEDSSRAKTEFLANMSHELRTPMHAILGFAEMGQTRIGPLQDERLRHYFERIHTSGSRLLNLLNDLLDLAKMEVGRMEYRMGPHDLAQAISEAVDEFSPLAGARAIQMETIYSVRPIIARMDSLRIGQVMRNLLSNAIKFSPDNSRIRVSVHLSDDSMVEVSVEDQGPGVPPGELETIFDKFIQSSATKTGAGGTGLGLAICREIIHAHQGEILASNTPDGGALFRFRIPRDTTAPEVSDHGS
ncbi:sensor histidine kinase [Paludibacterium paludis]|uniref:histidine kinase n=1 Tax=Paludibacterium paludis TaxID=1225769 RepID=A0A918P665_9NEIS|nr:ATP-binding protein [Paludibacterium paludis]GGY29789.1 hypothetical protein GCM10011289_35870 [Paludibacterium paludis]